MTWFRHPGFRRLERLSDGDCTPEEARRLREHLADCSRCREELAFLRSLDRTIREISTPRPPPGILEEALARREAGERRILPVEDPPPAPRRRAGGLAAAAAALAVIAAGVGAFFLLTTGEAAAGASELRIAPDALPALGPLPVEYRAASALASEERLRIRARYRYPADPPPRLNLGRPLSAEIERVGTGRFRGTVRLPPAAVYAVFSVEDRQAREVDANGGRFWETLARDPDGRPTFEALRERLLVMNHVRRELALETAVQLTELYPERIESWAHRLFYEGMLLDREGRDSLESDHRRRFTELERQVAGEPDVPAHQLAGLVQYARTLGDPDAIRRWTERLEEVAPTHRFAVQERVSSIARTHAEDATARLVEFEREWERSGPADETLLQAGFAAARDAGDEVAMLVWAERIDRYVPHWSVPAALELVEHPALRPDGMARLRAELLPVEAEDPQHRALDHNVPDHHVEAGRESAPLLAALGRALLAEADTAAALDTLTRAAERTWDPELFRLLAHVRLAATDTAGAIRLRALAAADPLQEPEVRVDLRLGPGPSVAPDAWRERLVEAEAELRRRAREASVSRPVPADIRVEDVAGVDRPLHALVEGGPTLLIYWAYLPSTARRDMAYLRSAAEALTAADVRVVPVTSRERTAELEAFARDPDLGLPVAFDEHGEAGHRLELLGRDRYLVIDASGRVRYRHREVSEALRHLLLLSEGAPRMSSPDRTGLAPADEGGATGIVTDHWNMGGNDATHFENHTGPVFGGGVGGDSPRDLERGDRYEQRLWQLGIVRAGVWGDVLGGWGAGVQRAPDRTVIG